MKIIDNKSSFIRKSFQLSYLRVIGSIIALLVNIILARAYEADAIGNYFISLGILIFSSQLATVGCEKWLVKSLSVNNSKKEVKEKISLAFFFVFLGALVSYSSYQLILMKVFNVDKGVGFFEFYSLSLFFITTAIFQANNKASFSLIVQYVLQPILFIVLVFTFTAPLITLYTVSFSLCLLYSCFYLFWSGYFRLGKFKVSKILITFKATVPYFTSMLIALLVTHLSLPLCSLWLDELSVAVMGVIIRLINVLFFAITGTRMLLLPLFTRAIAEQDFKSISQLSFLGRIYPTVVIVIGISVFTILSETIMRLFGDIYASYHYLLIVSSLLLLPTAFYGWSQSYLIVANHINLVTLSSLITAMLVFILLFY
ncbi:hypothetical protein ACLKMH_05910 [Psychromonas sp. KJ10-10]|uniref:hypothetical protein n=1 Tax=Psychromonas sp. KJ10-10 TaxID=3391823 RepID=UPI0039B386B2